MKASYGARRMHRSLMSISLVCSFSNAFPVNSRKSNSIKPLIFLDVIFQREYLSERIVRSLAHNALLWIIVTTQFHQTPNNPVRNVAPDFSRRFNSLQAYLSVWPIEQISQLFKQYWRMRPNSNRNKHLCERPEYFTGCALSEDSYRFDNHLRQCLRRQNF